MIIYRLQTYPGTDDWTNEFIPWRASADKALDKATVAEIPARLDELEVEPGREGLCTFLNQAPLNHMNQEPGRFIARNY